jgi:RHS repeat-associated protein
VIRYDYDALNRMTYKDLPNNAVYEYDAVFGYDLLGRLVGANDGLGHQISFGYDALGRRLTESSNWYGTTSSEYDLAGRRTHMTWKDGFRVDYSYLVTGEMKTIAENAAAVPGAMTLATFDYDDRGNRTKLTRGNGTVTDYTPDAVSRLQTLAQSFPASSTNNLTLGFAYNPAGQIVTNERSNNLYSWAGATPGSTATPPNALNQIASANGVGFSYDAKGNLTSDGTRSYSYDAENRLKSAGTASFFYDALGRLSWHTSLGSLLDYEGSRLVTELQGNTYAILRRYVHGPGSDEPLVSYEGTGTATRRWLHADERGSIVAITDAAGAVTAPNRYDEYGLPASTNVGRFQYTGQKWLPVLGLYDYKARSYDPRLGRFLEPDPIGYDDGMNMYAYVGGDPVNFIDQTGLERDCIETGSRLCGGADGLNTNRAALMSKGGNAFIHLDGGGATVCVKYCGARTRATGDDIVVYAPAQYSTIPSSQRWFVQDGRYLQNPSFREPSWARVYEYGFVFGPPAIAGAAVAVGATTLVSVIRFTPSAKHLAQAGGRFAKFNTNSVGSVRKIVYDALRSPGRSIHVQADGRYRITADLGRAIGTKGETSVRVVVSPSGKIITSFPVR